MLVLFNMYMHVLGCDLSMHTRIQIHKREFYPVQICNLKKGDPVGTDSTPPFFSLIKCLLWKHESDLTGYVRQSLVRLQGKGGLTFFQLRPAPLQKEERANWNGHHTRSQGGGVRRGSYEPPFEN